MQNITHIHTIWVNYCLFGTQEAEYPIAEQVGTLILDIHGDAYIKISDTHCRLASEEEIAEWNGPVSPWFKAGLYRKTIR